MMTIGFSSTSGMRSWRRSRLKMSVIFRYADVEPLDELDTDELGEKLLSTVPYFGSCGLSSPAGLSRRSNVSPVLYESAALPSAAPSFSSTSQVRRRIRSSNEVSVRCCFFLYCFGLISIKCTEKLMFYTYFGSYLIRDRRRAFRSIVLRIVSVSVSPLCAITGAVICDRFASSKAISASCVRAAVGTGAGNNCRTAEFGRSALWNMLECFFNATNSLPG